MTDAFTNRYLVLEFIMAKIYSLLVLLVVFSFHAFAQKNPLIRNCNIAGGEFLVADININHQADQIGLCKFGNTLVGALDVMTFLDSQKSDFPISFNEYQNSQTMCFGQVVTIQFVNSDIRSNVCLYNDKSIIDIATLITGKTSPQNTIFNHFLGF